MTLTHHVVGTTDGVQIHAVSTGNPSGRPIVFVHGFSASWRAWTYQLSDPILQERYLLVAIDLRGHGDSEGAIGMLDPTGRPLPALSDDRLVDETFGGGSRLWVNDVDAAIAGLGLSESVLVGWSYGGVVVQGYIHAHEGLGAGERALGAVGFSLFTRSEVRLAMLRRVFDYRPVLAGLPPETKTRIMAVTPQGDRLFHASVQNRLWAEAGWRTSRFRSKGTATCGSTRPTSTLGSRTSPDRRTHVRSID